jgi:hypothetical protein
MKARKRPALACGLLLAWIASAGIACSSDECNPEERLDESYMPVLDPADFQATIDHPLLPYRAGAYWLYEGGGETIEVTVTPDTKMILGINATVVRDVVSEDGEVIEDTFDWYAQDLDGNVWYLGEDTTEFENGEPVSTAGSWEAGVDGALPGIIMQADPAPGQTYRQEYYVCEAEDMGEVLSTTESVSVPYGDFDSCVEIRDFTPLEPGVEGHKFYCNGVGLTLELEGGARVELIEFTPGAA